MNYYLAVLKKYAVFSGRARRAEYWYFILFNSIIIIALNLAMNLIPASDAIKNIIGILLGIYSLAVFIPSLAVGVRRLHDTNRSGWWLFISLVPLIGGIVLLVFFVSDSQPDQNRYGPNPKQIVN